MNSDVNNHDQSRGSYLAYGLLGLPLAMSALPVYVQIPTYYTSQLGLALATTGWVIFAARFVDAVQDPILGRMIDKLHGRVTSWFCMAGVLLAAAFFGLWVPLVSQPYLAVWLAVLLVIAYTAHSMLSIAYLSWGARLVDLIKLKMHPNRGLLGAAAWREVAGLIGVILASVIPSMIMSTDPREMSYRFGWYSVAFALLLAIAIVALLRRAPAWQSTEVIYQNWRAEWKSMISNSAFKALLIPYFVNAVSVSVPATLVLFFINDQLQAASYSAAFLATYFIAAAIGLPCWVKIAEFIGTMNSWRLGMAVSIVSFISAGTLGAGAIVPFFLVCIASGFALGADLVLPPVLLAKIIRQEAPPAIYYGVWTLLAKLALACSGISLPLLAYWGYQPGQSSIDALSWVYAGVPCLMKLIALIWLFKSDRLVPKNN